MNLVSSLRIYSIKSHQYLTIQEVNSLNYTYKTEKDHAEGKPSSEALNKAKVKTEDALT